MGLVAAMPPVSSGRSTARAALGYFGHSPGVLGLSSALRSSARSSTSGSTTTFGPGKIADYLKRLHGLRVPVPLRLASQARDIRHVFIRPRTPH